MSSAVLPSSVQDRHSRSRMGQLDRIPRPPVPFQLLFHDKLVRIKSSRKEPAVFLARDIEQMLLV